MFDWLPPSVIVKGEEKSIEFPIETIFFLTPLLHPFYPIFPGHNTEKSKQKTIHLMYVHNSVQSTVVDILFHKMHKKTSNEPAN